MGELGASRAVSHQLVDSGYPASTRWYEVVVFLEPGKGTGPLLRAILPSLWYITIVSVHACKAGSINKK